MSSLLDGIGVNTLDEIGGVGIGTVIIKTADAGSTLIIYGGDGSDGSNVFYFVDPTTNPTCDESMMIDAKTTTTNLRGVSNATDHRSLGFGKTKDDSDLWVVHKMSFQESDFSNTDMHKSTQTSLINCANWVYYNDNCMIDFKYNEGSDECACIRHDSGTFMNPTYQNNQHAPVNIYRMTFPKLWINQGNLKKYCSNRGGITGSNGMSINAGVFGYFDFWFTRGLGVCANWVQKKKTNCVGTIITMAPRMVGVTASIVCHRVSKRIIPITTRTITR